MLTTTPQTPSFPPHLSQHKLKDDLRLTTIKLIRVVSSLQPASSSPLHFVSPSPSHTVSISLIASKSLLYNQHFSFSVPQRYLIQLPHTHQRYLPQKQIIVLVSLHQRIIDKKQSQNVPYQEHQASQLLVSRQPATSIILCSILLYFVSSPTPLPSPPNQTQTKSNQSINVPTKQIHVPYYDPYLQQRLHTLYYHADKQNRNDNEKVDFTHRQIVIVVNLSCNESNNKCHTQFGTN